jgi:hypothetical protein
MPFQQVHHQDRETALKLAAIAAPHTFDLLGDVGDINRGQFAGAQKTSLLDGPGIEVFLVFNRVAGHHRSSNAPAILPQH